MKKTLIYIMTFVLALTTAACNFSKKTSPGNQQENTQSGRQEDPQTTFAHFLDDTFKAYVTQDALTLHSHLASQESYDNLGIKKTDITNLPSFTEAWYEQRLKQNLETLKALQEFDRSALTQAQTSDYDFLENELTLSIKNGEDYPYYKTYLGRDGCPSALAVSLSQYYFRDKEDIEVYFQLLKQVPDYLNSFADYEIRRQGQGFSPSTLLVEDTLDEIKEFLSCDVAHNLLTGSFAERLDSMESLSGRSRKAYLAENEKLLSKTVLPAYKDLKDRLKMELKPSDHKERIPSFKFGEEYYAFLLKKNVGTDLTPDQCEDILSAMQKDLLEKSRKLTSDHEGLYETLIGTPPGLTDPEEILNTLLENCMDDFPELDPGSDDNKEAENNSEDFALLEDLDTNCQLVELPEALSSTAASAFFVNPPLDVDDQNIIYLNKMRLNISTLPSILAHEGYPGHLYQTSYYKNKLAHPIYSLWRNSGFDEGWGTYAQLYGYKIMDFSDEDEETAQALKELYSNNDLFSLCLCGLSDLYVNYENYDRTELTDWLSQYGITADRAEEIYHYVLQQPTSYLTYIIGYYEIEQMLEEASQAEDFSLFNFHKSLLDHGSCPFYLINKG